MQMDHFFHLHQKIALHQGTIGNHYGMFIFPTHKYNHSEPAEDLPVPCPHTWMQKNDYR